MHQYYLKVVPTMYVYTVSDNSREEFSHQFSITRNQKDIMSGAAGLPGFFVQYEFSPLMVKYEERRKYVFLCSLTAWLQLGQGGASWGEHTVFIIETFSKCSEIPILSILPPSKPNTGYGSLVFQVTVALSRVFVCDHRRRLHRRQLGRLVYLQLLARGAKEDPTQQIHIVHFQFCAKWFFAFVFLVDL